MATNARIEELRKKFEENPKRYFAPLANEYRKAGDPEQAISICEMYLHQQPGHMSGHIVYGQALFEANKLDKAKEIFEAALTLDNENLIALKHLGDIARMAGDAYGARAWYLRILEADPRNEEIQGYIADLEKQGLSTEAGPGGSEGDSVNGSAGSDGGRRPEERFPANSQQSEDLAPENRRRSEQISPSDPPVEISEFELPPPPPPMFVTETMGDLYLDQGHSDQALNVYEQVAEQKPDDESLRSKIRELRGESQPDVEANTEAAKDFFARIVAHKPGATPSPKVSPLDEMFGDNAPSSADSDAAAQLARAFADMDDQSSNLS